MRMLRSFVAASVGLCATGALAGTFPSPPLYPSFSPAKEQIITIDPPGALASYAVAINAEGKVAGYYADKNGAYRGFIRKANGTFLSFGARKENFSVSDMNQGGDVIGNFNASGFIRKADGTITKFVVPNSTVTYPNAINNNGEIAGYFIDTNHNDHGFLRTSSGTITVIDAPGSGGCSGAELYGINLAGTTIGQGCNGPFVRDAQGNFTMIAPPGSTACSAIAINASGAVIGYFSTSNETGHSYIRDPSGSLTIVDPPHPGRKETYTVMSGLNKAGGTVGSYGSDDINRQIGFIRSAAGVFTTLRVPGGARSIFPTSINDRRQVTGYYYASDGGDEPHAFLRTQ
jgi:hypothetical protein